MPGLDEDMMMTLFTRLDDSAADVDIFPGFVFAVSVF